MGHSSLDSAFHELRPWNEGRLLGAKRALKPQQVWAIRFWLGHHRRLRDRAMFDLAIDSKLRGCDVVKIRIGDILVGIGVVPHCHRIAASRHVLENAGCLAAHRPRLGTRESTGRLVRECLFAVKDAAFDYRPPSLQQTIRVE